MRACWDAELMEGPSDGDADAKAALLLIQVLILALIEQRAVDGEVLRRIADDVVTTEVDVDPAAMTQIILRLNSVIQDTYALQPVNTSLSEPEADGPGGEPLT